MIEINGLNLTIGGTAILSDVHLTINDGETLGIIGKTGAGKTSLLKCMAGSIKNFRGRTAYNGMPLPRRAGMAARTVSYCGAPAPGNRDETLYNFILLARVSYKKILRPFSDYDRQTADEYMEIFALGPYTDAPLGTLPDGVYRRAILAHTLVKEAYAVILDNPTNDLDFVSVKLLGKALARYVMNGDHAAVVCSNDLNFISHIADRIVLMDGGRIAETGNTDLLNSDLIKQYFGIDVIISKNVYNGRPEIQYFPD
jgi:iron complex transport system ATP-binding protein